MVPAMPPGMAKAMPVGTVSRVLGAIVRRAFAVKSSVYDQHETRVPDSELEATRVDEQTGRVIRQGEAGERGVGVGSRDQGRAGAVASRRAVQGADCCR